MTRYMSNELDYAPWVTAERQLGYPSLVLARFPVTFGYFEASVVWFSSFKRPACLYMTFNVHISEKKQYIGGE